MANPGSLDRAFDSGAGPLSRMFHLDEAETPDWIEEDLQAMLCHQMDAPLLYDLRSSQSGGKASETIAFALGQAAVLGIRTFRDAFTHPEPPLDLLKAVKDLFKKRSGASPERRPEQQVAYVLYLMAIVTAKSRRQRWITKLSEEDVLRGTQWAGAQKWVNDDARQLLTAPGMEKGVPIKAGQAPDQEQ